MPEVKNTQKNTQKYTQKNETEILKITITGKLPKVKNTDAKGKYARSHQENMQL